MGYSPWGHKKLDTTQQPTLKAPVLVKGSCVAFGHACPWSCLFWTLRALVCVPVSPTRCASPAPSPVDPDVLGVNLGSYLS